MNLKLALGALGALSVVSLAAAADLSPSYPGGYKEPPVYVANTWTGFYAGVNIGYGWNPKRDDIVLFNDGKEFAFPGPEAGGVFGGGQVGYNFQPGFFGAVPSGGNFILGVEADLQASDISDDYGTLIFGIPAKVKSDLNYFGTVRGRVGYALDRTLLYFTGGFAFGNVETVVSDSFSGSLKKDAVLTGYGIGGGIEHKFTPNLSLKVEYLYINLGDYRLTDGVGSASLATTGKIDADFHTVRVGLNYHFNQTYEPLK